MKTNENKKFRSFTKSLNHLSNLPSSDRFKILEMWRKEYVNKLKAKYNFTKTKI
tara:strand:- start:591 stop:752 length:162 start_codon:yes stop_codon:yes gene_type:complete